MIRNCKRAHGLKGEPNPDSGCGARLSFRLELRSGRLAREAAVNLAKAGSKLAALLGTTSLLRMSG